MTNDSTTASIDNTDTPSCPLITTASGSGQRRQPTVVDDAPPDWEWEDWAAGFWSSEPHALAGDYPPSENARPRP